MNRIRDPRIEELRDFLLTSFNQNGSPGMPPPGGLLYQPIPFPEFADIPHERDSSREKWTMLSRSVPFGGKRVLDLGCANGYFEFKMATADHPPAQMLAIDALEDNIEVARRVQEIFGVPNIEFRHARIDRKLVEDLVSTEEFDVVLLLSLHHHLIRAESIEDVKSVFQTLYERCGVLIVEQGSLTQDEYTAWTGRTEEFFTVAYTRLLWMLEASGIPRGHCRIVGEGMYQSGLRPDAGGAGRVIVAASRAAHPDRVEDFESHRHKNGMVVELIRDRSGGAPRFRKHSLRWPSYIDNELAALRRLAGSPFVPRVIEEETSAARNLLTMDRLELEPIQAGTPQIRKAFLSALETMAGAGVIHNELHPLHVVLDAGGHLRILDFETAYVSGTDREEWLRDIYATNPLLGLEVYPRDIHETPAWIEADLRAADALLAGWNLPRLSTDEKESLLAALRRSFRIGP